MHLLNKDALSEKVPPRRVKVGTNCGFISTRTPTFQKNHRVKYPGDPIVTIYHPLFTIDLPYPP